MIYFVSNALSIIESNFKHTTIDYVINYFKDKKSIAVDTETTGFDPHTKTLIALQLGDEENQFVIDCRYIDVSRFKELLESKLLIFHNAKFDYKFLKTVNINVNNVWDTFLAEEVLYCGYKGFGFSLGALCQRYLSITLDKETRSDFTNIVDNPLTDKQIQYAALDVAYLHKIAKIQHKQLLKYDLMYAANLEFEAVKVFGDIEYNGVLFDSSLWGINTLKNKQTLKDITEKLDSVVLEDPLLKTHYKHLGILDDLFGGKHRQLNINYSSPAQVKQLLEQLGLSVENTNSSELIKLRNKHKIIPIIEEYRETDKAISTYGDKFLKNINVKTGRIHTDIWQILNTYRISSNDPNLQNIPKENLYRNCFITREGYSWLSIDYQSQELRIMADYSDEDGFIDILNKGEDLHCFAGTMMFKKPVTKENKELRDKAKTINFGKPLTFNMLYCKNAASLRK